MEITLLNITDLRTLSETTCLTLDPVVRSLLLQRCEQLLSGIDCDRELADVAQFVVVDPHDTVAAIEQAAGYPVVTAPAFEWVAYHHGWFEAVTILSDDGFGLVLLVPDQAGIRPELLILLREAMRHSPVAP